MAVLISLMPKAMLVGDMAAPGKAMLVGLMLFAPPVVIGKPGGVGMPGGGPFAVVKDCMFIPFIPGNCPLGETGVCGPPKPPG